MINAEAELRAFVIKEIETQRERSPQRFQFRAPQVLLADVPVAGEPGDLIYVPDAAAGSRFRGYVDAVGWVNLG